MLCPNLPVRTAQADAAFLPLFFPEDPTLGRKVYYVAGGNTRDPNPKPNPNFKPKPNPNPNPYPLLLPQPSPGRVVGDPLAQPFSMGRNLFCVHSKKYIDVEEDAAEKSAMSKQNRRTLTEMSKAMKIGRAHV